jgi:hypothetical protein
VTTTSEIMIVENRGGIPATIEEGPEESRFHFLLNLFMHPRILF